MENGTWAPMAAKLMRAELDGMKNITVCDAVVTIRSAANAAAEHLIRHVKGIHRNAHNSTGQGHHSIMVNFFLQSGIHRVLLCKQNILNMFFMYIL